MQNHLKSVEERSHLEKLLVDEYNQRRKREEEQQQIVDHQLKREVTNIRDDLLLHTHLHPPPPTEQEQIILNSRPADSLKAVSCISCSCREAKVLRNAAGEGNDQRDELLSPASSPALS